MSGTKPDCIKCGWKPVIPENFEAIEIINNYMLLMVNEHGLNATGVDLVLKWEDKSDDKILRDKILIYITNAFLQSRSK